MIINNCTSSPNFNGLWVNTSRMTQKERNIAISLCRAIEGSMKYDFNKKGVDAFITLGQKKNTYKVRFLDLFSGEFIKKDGTKNSIDEISISLNKNIYDSADRIIEKYSKVCNEGKRPEVNYNKIISGKTPLAKIKPEFTEEIHYDYERFLSNNTKPREAKILAVDIFNSLIPKEGYSFNF